MPLTHHAMDGEKRTGLSGMGRNRDGGLSKENLKLTWRPGDLATWRSGSYNIKSSRDGKIEMESATAGIRVVEEGVTSKPARLVDGIEL